jgi:predicted GIY-YIG superfamily endonuclease
MTTYLYRLWDDADRLLYVGISKSAIHRLHEHLTEQPWAEQVAKQTIERHETRQEALAAETLAIKSEAPLYNVVHNKPLMWKQQKKTRFISPVSGVTRGDTMTAQVTRHTKEEFKPIRVIADRYVQRLIHEALVLINKMLLELDRRSEGQSWDAVESITDLIYSISYLPFSDFCQTCDKDSAELLPFRWPVGVNSEQTYLYECHICGSTWTCWYAGKPLSKTTVVLDLPV